MVTSYIDNNKTIYTQDKSLNINITAGSYVNLSLGLQDIPQLSGQSTVYVNKVFAKFKGYAHSGGANQSYGSFTVGVVPEDIRNLPWTGLASFMDYQAFPLKNGSNYWWAYSGDAGNPINTVSSSFTYSPRKTLVINREQVIVANINHLYGVNVTGLLSLRLQLKRAG
jgi:hypothetical protein